ncbi:MBL fold metallo-hydrolase [Candidatus Falkowbacteria bacterium]|nr:MBL fold metallo-hydrolase [Candidatus Falkowbacteria bacterium]
MFNFRSKKFILKLVGLAAAVLILFSVALFESSEESKALEVDFLDVGQGDAILIKTPDHQRILIDGGPSGAVVNKLGENLPFFEKEIDLIILTHPHADHLDGLIEVLKRYEVKKILTTGVTHTTPDYLAWLEEIKKQNVPMEIAVAGQTLDFGSGIKMEIFYPKEDLTGKSAENLNNTSVVAKLIFGQTSFLFTGDAETEVEDELIGGGVDLKADVLKVAHHGSKNAMSQNFLEKVKPKFAVISVGADNQFGHPNAMTVKRLEKIGVEVFRTDKDGDVKMVSDGDMIEVEK